MTEDVRQSLLLDLYELTMVHAYRRAGMERCPATFSLFIRSLPPGRSYLIAAGLEDALDWLEGLCFGDKELAAIEKLDLFPPDFVDWLAELHFEGDVRAVREGEPVFAGEPLIEVDAPLAQGQLAESFLLNQLAFQTALATAAARYRHAAHGRPVVDFALRRSHGIDAAMKLSRVGRIVGLAATSNVAGWQRYGLSANGTMAHSLVQAHLDETEAFRTLASTLGANTVLLVDTYDIARGIERAIVVAKEMRARGVEIHGIRIDSGELAPMSRLARRRLDEEGFGRLRVIVSGGLDEHEVERLVEVEEAPIDGFGVGAHLAVPSGGASLDAVYKLVACDGRPVRKTSPGKGTWPGPKQVWRSPDFSGDTLQLREESPPDPGARGLLVSVMKQGRRTKEASPSLEECRSHFEYAWGEMPESLKGLDGDASYDVSVSEALKALAAEIDRSGG